MTSIASCAGKLCYAGTCTHKAQGVLEPLPFLPRIKKCPFCVVFNEHMRERGRSSCLIENSTMHVRAVSVFLAALSKMLFGGLILSTMMDRFLTLLGDPLRCNNLFHFKRKTA